MGSWIVWEGQAGRGTGETRVQFEECYDTMHGQRSRDWETAGAKGWGGQEAEVMGSQVGREKGARKRACCDLVDGAQGLKAGLVIQGGTEEGGRDMVHEALPGVPTDQG